MIQYPDLRGVAAEGSSNPEYAKCKRDDHLEWARCELLDQSRGGRIKLIFIRYDEGQRNVTHGNFAEKLAAKKPNTNP